MTMLQRSNPNYLSTIYLLLQLGLNLQQNFDERKITHHLRNLNNTVTIILVINKFGASVANDNFIFSIYKKPV